MTLDTSRVPTTKLLEQLANTVIRHPPPVDVPRRSGPHATDPAIEAPEQPIPHQAGQQTRTADFHIAIVWTGPIGKTAAVTVPSSRLAAAD